MDENNNFRDGDSINNQGNDPIQNSEIFGTEHGQEQNHSESQQSVSEDVPQPSENIQNGSEALPNDSETSLDVSEKDVETFGIKNTLPEKTPEHTLTVREIARLFEEAGAPRTERSIINWCNPNKRGIKRLDCFFDEVDRKYFVTHQSVHSVIQEERKKQQFTDFNVPDISEQNSTQFGKDSEPKQNHSEGVPNDSEDFGTASENVQNGSETARKEPKPDHINERYSEHQSTHNRDENPRSKEVENELNDLRITNKAKDYFIDRLQEQSEKERQSYIEERKFLIEQLTHSSKKIGELETKLLQIEAPKKEFINTIGEEVHGRSVLEEKSQNIHVQNSNEVDGDNHSKWQT